ncbi:hypothetical protein TYRP_007024 [Tyrophagus putrescentiae]|nr:hypothetical protein TYRP_007024 [Tyrophagus putrescentiae]
MPKAVDFSRKRAPWQNPNTRLRRRGCSEYFSSAQQKAPPFSKKRKKRAENASSSAQNTTKPRRTKRSELESSKTFPKQTVRNG